MVGTSSITAHKSNCYIIRCGPAVEVSQDGSACMHDSRLELVLERGVRIRVGV